MNFEQVKEVAGIVKLKVNDTITDLKNKIKPKIRRFVMEEGVKFLLEEDFLPLSNKLIRSYIENKGINPDAKIVDKKNEIKKIAIGINENIHQPRAAFVPTWVKKSFKDPKEHAVTKFRKDKEQIDKIKGDVLENIFDNMLPAIDTDKPTENLESFLFRTKFDKSTFRKANQPYPKDGELEKSIENFSETPSFKEKISREIKNRTETFLKEEHPRTGFKRRDAQPISETSEKKDSFFTTEHPIQNLKLDKSPSIKEVENFKKFFEETNADPDYKVYSHPEIDLDLNGDANIDKFKEDLENLGIKCSEVNFDELTDEQKKIVRIKNEMAKKETKGLLNSFDINPENEKKRNSHYNELENLMTDKSVDEVLNNFIGNFKSDDIYVVSKILEKIKHSLESKKKEMTKSNEISDFFTKNNPDLK